LKVKDIRYDYNTDCVVIFLEDYQCYMEITVPVKDVYRRKKDEGKSQGKVCIDQGED